MSNWLYGQQVPTEKWRSAMTIARELSIEKIDDKYLVVSKPVKEISSISGNAVQLKNISATDFDLTSKTGKLSGPVKLKVNFSKGSDFSITLSNSLRQKLVIGFDAGKSQYFIDRTQSGKVDFQKDFAGIHTAPRFAQNQSIDLTLIIDNASVELFADDGLTVMTSIFFPDENYTDIKIDSKDNYIKGLEFTKLKSIYTSK
jgi:fructan beta-fructosidase